MRLSEKIREQKTQLREIKSLIEKTKRERLHEQIRHYNIRVKRLKDDCVKWLEELGYSVTVEEQEVPRAEWRGEYMTREYTLSMDNGLVMRIVPHGIWTIVTKGRVRIESPTGMDEDIDYFFKTKPARWKEHVKEEDVYANIPETGWYLIHSENRYCDTKTRRRIRMSKDILVRILGLPKSGT